MSDTRCPKCNHPMRCNSYSEEWTCLFHTFSTQYLAARSLGPFAPKRSPEVPREHIPGFRWSAQEQCYVRIASDDEVAKSVADDMRRWHAKGRPGW